jgi:hypothetical protein
MADLKSQQSDRNKGAILSDHAPLAKKMKNSWPSPLFQRINRDGD